MLNLQGTLSDPQLCAALIERIHQLAAHPKLQGKPFRFMEVCGTHTVALFRSGVISMLPTNIVHLSGPGCPVCVTHDSEIAAAISLAERQGKENIHVLTFGDLMRVPGPNGHTLKKAKAMGAKVDIIYSPLECLAIAQANPASEVVFLGVGFETTSPAIAATVLEAERLGIKNFSVLCCHKLVPPALHALLNAAPAAPAKKVGESKTHALQATHTGIDGFILPGHVSTILGVEAYDFLASLYHKPSVVTGFEPADLLQAIFLLLQMTIDGEAKVINEYIRAVHTKGNPKAREIMFKVFQISNARWRGLGDIPDSGLAFRPEFAHFDAVLRLGVEFKDTPPPKGCMCGEALAGLIQPPQCPLFGKLCTPQNPVGPCMVSTEGSCAAYYNYAM